MNRSLLYHLSRNLCLVALAFLLLLGCLLAAESQRASKALPGTEVIIADLRGQIGEKSGDRQFVDSLRDLDLLYRQTYFRHHDRMNLGRILAAAGLFAFLAGAAGMAITGDYALRKPSGAATAAQLQQNTYLRHGLAAAMAVVMVALVITTIRDASQPQRQTPPADAPRPGAAETASSQAAATKTIPLADLVPVLPLPEALARAANFWPGFRGSILPNQNRLPANWNLRTAWSTKVPLPGYNSPVIWENRIYLTGGDKKERAIFCFSLEDGSLLWTCKADHVAKLPTVTDDTGYAAPTAVVDDNSVIAVFATGQIIAADHQGNRRWTSQMPDQEISYGYAASPLLAGDTLVLQHDMEKQQTILGLDPLTGNIRWQTTRPAATSWSSPTLLLTADGFPVIFTAGSAKAEAFDLTTGKQLWENECLGGEVATSAFVYQGNFYFANAGTVAIAFEPLSPTPRWQNHNVPMPDVASPVAAENTMYLFTSGGTVIGLNASTGEELFEENFDNGFYSSPVVVGGKIIAVNLDGKLIVVTPSSERFILEAEHDLEKSVVAIPAFAQGRIIIRTVDNQLLCLEAAP